MDVEQDPSNYAEEHLFEVETKVETLLEESIVEDATVEEAPVQYDRPLTNQSIGPEDAIYHLSFMVTKAYFRNSKQSTGEITKWTIRTSSVREFRRYLFKLLKPHIKRAVEFVSTTEPSWSNREEPTEEDLHLYVSFKCKVQKRIWKLESVDDHKLNSWSNSRTIEMQYFVYSNQIMSRAAFDLVKDILLDPSNTSRILRETNEELKLLTMMKRLQKIHRTHLIAREADAFKMWAQMILQANPKKQSELCYQKPPKGMLHNFTVLRKTHPHPKKQYRKPTGLGPAQREQVPDGFGFEDEVQALRQTVSQIKDLMEMLDRRVGLLEEKCHGYKQIVQGGGPVKKAKWDDDDDNGDEDGDQGANGDEPSIDEPFSDEEGAAEGYSGENPDPLLFNDMLDYVKQEDEIEDDD